MLSRMAEPIVNIHEAKTHLSRLVERVEAGDPFDRMLVAQASRLDAVVVTRDTAFGAYGVRVLAA
jgi:PIN domain nuclease of toxin-antitoxin system